METESAMKPLFLDEEWFIRRSERIFLSDPSPQASPNYTPQSSKPQLSKTPKLESKAKLQKAKNMKELTQKVKRKYKKSMEKRSSQKVKEKNEVHIFFLKLQQL